MRTNQKDKSKTFPSQNVIHRQSRPRFAKTNRTKSYLSLFINFSCLLSQAPFVSLSRFSLALSLSPMAKLFAFGALWLCLVVTVICPRHCVSVRSDQEIRDRFYGNLLNGTAPDSGDGSIAKMFDRVLEKEFSEKEFSENDQPEGKAFASLFFFFIVSCWFVVVLDAIFF